MKKNILATFAIFCVSLVGLTLLSGTARAQSATKTTVVTVTNTTCNPVPVTGGVAITNTPTVQLDQSANTVKIDPNSNVCTTCSAKRGADWSSGTVYVFAKARLDRSAPR